MARTDRPIGIVAGSGSLPVEGARSIVERGCRVHVVMADEYCDPALKAFPHTVVNWAQVGRTMRAFKRSGVRDVVMLGATRRPSFRRARPDWGFISALPSILAFLNAGGDDAVLRGLVRLFERHGLAIVGPAEVLPEMLIGEGAMTPALPSSGDDGDIAMGFALIRALGHYDIGQAAVVREKRMIAIEGAEGTDRMLQHAASRIGNETSRAGVLVKLAKPGQDMRVDLPTIGPATVDNAIEANVAGIAAKPGQVLVAERERMIAMANANGLFIFGAKDEAVPAPSAVSRISLSAGLSLTALPDRERSDAEKAARILAALAAFDTGTALVIFDNRVIVLGTDELPSDVIRRANSIRRSRKRKGLAAIGLNAVIDKTAVTAAHDANLAGLVVVRNAPENLPKAITDLADKFGLFIAFARIEGDVR